MPNLPTRNYEYYIGIDPGYTGALAAIRVDGGDVQVWDMPVSQPRGCKTREYDLIKLQALFNKFALTPDPVIGLEWYTTRPGEGAERAKRSGVGMGQLEVFAFTSGIDYYRIAPQLWKGRLGLPGKTHPDANKIVAEAFDMYYPVFTHLIRGPRGGIKDGRLDALMIAHFLRTCGTEGMRAVVKKYGKGSVEAMALMLKGGRPRCQLPQ